MIKATFLLLAIGASALPPQHRWNNRIIGGYTANDGQFPHHVSMKIGGNHQCGGSILDRTTILTAAHCFYGFSGYFTIEVGTNLLSGGGVKHDIWQIRNHEAYDPSRIRNDIAIAKIGTEIVYGQKVNSIGIQPVFVDEGIWCKFCGWGSTHTGGLPNNLQYIDLMSITNEKCKEMHPGEPGVYDTQLCVFNGAFGQGICGGDSGSALTVNGRVAGIASWVRGCGVGYPDVFTRVTSFLDWIERNKV